MINIVIPMAGRGSRVKEKYQVPKPFIEIGGKPMIQWVIDNLRPQNDIEYRFIFIVQEAHIQEYDLSMYLSPQDDYKIYSIDYITDGPADSVCLAKDIIDNDESILIANCDQCVDIDFTEYLTHCVQSNADGNILTFTADGHTKWSYIKRNSENHIVDVKEKIAISNEATVGIYFFKKGNDFIRAVDKMKAKGEMVNNEYYVAPSYNELIEEGKLIEPYLIDMKAMAGLGTIEDLEDFVDSTIYKRHKSNITP